MLLRPGKERNFQTPLKIVDTFKYLGINITLEAEEALKANIDPLVEYVKNKVGVWKKLLLSMAGRVQLIKSIILPKCLYVMAHSEVKIPKYIFKKFNSLLTRFIWANGRCKLKLSTLQRPNTAAGLAIPDLYLYYLAGQLKHLRTWVVDEREMRVEKYLLNKMQVGDLLVGLEIAELRRTGIKIPLLKLARSVWKEVKKLTGYRDIPPEISLWNNPMFEKLEIFDDSSYWKQNKTKTIGQMYNNNVIVTYENMCKQYNLQSKQFCRYLQLRHLLREQFERKEPKISRYPLIGILKSQGPKGTDI